jgi:TPR repeat protein
MKPFIYSIVAAAALGLSTPGFTQDFELGWAALQGGDYPTALGHLEPLASQGDDRAMVGMGYLYLNGFAVSESYMVAFKLFSDAADLGNSDAMYSLANGYYMGEWLDQDFELAVHWYRQLELVMEDGPVRTGVEALRQSAEAMSLLEGGAVNGVISDQIDLAERYAENTVVQNFEKSVRWFRAAAEQDDLQSQLRVAEMYQSGQGGTPDSREAHFWYSIALARGAEEAARPREILAGTLTAEALESNAGRVTAWLARHPL